MTDTMTEVDDFGTLEEGDEVVIRYDSTYSEEPTTERRATVVNPLTNPPRLIVSPDGSDKEWRLAFGKVSVKGAMSWGKNRPREIGHRYKVFRDTDEQLNQ